MFDLISIGDATIDNLVLIHDAEIRCNLDKSKCMLCIEYGDKISVDKLVRTVAGNAANSAVGAQRLNLKSAIYVNIGTDSAGKQILQTFKKEGVSTRYVVIEDKMESNLSTVLSFQGERTIFVYHQDWRYKLPDLDSTRWVYFTSLGPSLAKSNLLNELTSYLQRSSCKMLYSPGTYQIKLGITKNPKLLALTEIIIVNLSESKRILGHEDSDNIAIKKLLTGLADLGPKMVIITDAIKGSYGYDGINYYFIESFPAKLVESTGAGDAYSTAVLAALYNGKNLSEAMRWGSVNSASVVGYVGAQAGLLTLSQMQQKLKENSKITAKVI